MKKPELKRRWADPNYLADIDGKLDALFDAKSLTVEVDFRGMIVGLDGAIGRLEHASFEHANVRLADLSYCRFSCSFASSDFSDVRFDESYFDTCIMSRAKFSNCGFEASRIAAPTMDDALFSNCNFSRASLKGRGTYEYGGRRVTFQSCDFRESQLKSLRFRACRFIGCKFEDAYFENCDLRGAKFDGCGARPDQFVGCDKNGISIS